MNVFALVAALLIVEGVLIGVFVDRMLMHVERRNLRAALRGVLDHARAQHHRNGPSTDPAPLPYAPAPIERGEIIVLNIRRAK